MAATFLSCFVDVFAGWRGNSNDERVWKQSAIYTRLGNEHKLPAHYYLLSDAAYPMESFILSPNRDNGQLTPGQVQYKTK